MPQILRARKGISHSEVVLHDFEQAFVKQGLSPLGDGRPNVFWDSIGRASSRLRISWLSMRPRDQIAILGMMGLSERQYFPYLRRFKIVPYIWDCWPTRQSDWLSFFNRFSLPLIFFSSRDAADYWRPLLPNSVVRWTPEAIDETQFPPGPPLDKRPVTLLEIGRKYEDAHLAAKTALRNSRSSHLHGYDSTEDFLPTRLDLVSALQSTRALLCYPAAVTHPSGRTGAWETMTHRYLEAISTKTIVVGKIPNEMKSLFGFTPGVECDVSELPSVLLDIATRPGAYQQLADDAHRTLLSRATWKVRSTELLDILANQGLRTQ